MTPPVKQLVHIHILPIRVTFMDTGLYLGSLNPQFIKEIGELLMKWKVVHLEVAIMPCTRDQKVKIDVQSGEELPMGEGNGSPYGP